MPCYDIEGNATDCGGDESIGYSAPGNNATALDFSAPSPSDVGRSLATSSSDNGGSALAWATSLGGLATSIFKTVSAPSPSGSGVKLQLNPATGSYQYFNPATGQYTAPAGSTSLFSGNSLILVIAALAVAFFAFGGRKRLAAA